MTLKKLGLTVLLCAFHLGCASVPKTKEEFREAAKKLDKQVIELNEVTFLEAKKRMKEFSEKCLNVSITKTSSTSGPYGPVASTSVTKQKTIWVETEKQATVYLQTDYGSSNPFQKPPAGGYFTMMIELESIGKMPQAIVYYYDSSLVSIYRVMAKSAAAWIGMNKKLCPEY